MKNSVDLTLPFHEGTLLFPGDPKPSLVSEEGTFGDGDYIRTTHLSTSVHVGTHLDAPGHFIKGAAMVDAFPLETFLGEVLILDLSHCDRVITKGDLERLKISNSAKVFIKTKNSGSLIGQDFNLAHVYLDPLAAEYLASLQISLLGFDYYNIDNSETSALPSHLILAKAGVPVIVAIDASRVSAGHYHFSALPMSLKNIEGSPVRVAVWPR